MAKNKIKVAFVKYAGLGVGGTEKFLQVIAANLPKERFEVDYYYTSAAPYIGSDWVHPDNDKERGQYLLDHGVNLIPVTVKFKDVTQPIHPWVDTNFWQLFDQKRYHIVQTGRAGHPEYPFTGINAVPIVDSIHLPGMVDTQENIAAVVHVSNWNKDYWVTCGGNKDLTHVVYHPISLPKVRSDLRSELNLEDVFVYGLHQRVDDGIFSPIPLEGYAKIESDKTAFVLLGGSQLYGQQAVKLGLKNFHQLPAENNFKNVCKFLKTLDVYAHGRADGENNSQAIAEAMGHGLPVVSHFAKANGHVEQIGDSGFIVVGADDYAKQLKKLHTNSKLHKEVSNKAKKNFTENYSLDKNINKIIRIYEDVYASFDYDKHKEDDWMSSWLYA